MADAAQRIGARLAGLAAEGADAATIASEASSAWRAIEAALTPVVGEGGFAALLSRCVQDTRRHHPWLAWRRDPDAGDGLVVLQAAFAGRGAADTLAAATALLECFCGLMNSLVGAALTERLLRNVEPVSTRGTDAEDDPR